ncbi:MAG TPA: hypothetical protein VNJ08_03550 [Bacteriovoracaceae bacterium]|nr:hypothetical protein [Bacteriovoracaceae bacterium]
MKTLNVYVPFVFSEKIDPRAVYTVGDQLVSEHIFAFHNSVSAKKAVQPLFSNIIIDKINNLLTIDFLREIFNSDGHLLDINEICSSIKSSFAGTQHTNYKSLVESIDCQNRKIKIKFSTIPINLEYWLRSTDFAIFDTKKLPLSKSSLQPTTGPYTLTYMDSLKVELTANKFFPKEFVSNEVEKVILKSYPASDIDSIFKKEDVDLAYLYGYSIRPELINELKGKNFKIQVFPNEWLMYLGFQKSVDLESRNLIASKIDTLRNSFKNKIVYGSTAYSTIPSDRAYGLTEAEYEKLKTPVKSGNLKNKLTISTLDEWAQIPLFSYILEELKKELNIELKLVSRKDMNKIYSQDEADFYLSPMGVSAADPLGNYSFFFMYDELFKKVLSEELLVSLYKEKDFHKFSLRIKDIEIQLLQERVIVPIGHFPGIVIESQKVIRDESKSWDWGIQAWTYKII